MRTRETTVSGQFYPSNPEEIKKIFSHYNSIIEEHLRNKEILYLKPRALIVPHAGYLYSAFTANIAMRLLKNTEAEKVAVIGPSHRVYLHGTSISDYDNYETPLGTLSIDRDLVDALHQYFGLPFVPEAHREHSTEVEMPFIKNYKPHASVVELVYGEETAERLAEIIDYLLEDPHTVVVVSTDLSHYYDLQKAKKHDTVCMDAVYKLDPSILHRGCEACGKTGLEAILLSAGKKGLQPVILEYRTSADAGGDTTQVVGYMSAAFIPGDASCR